MDFAVNDAVRYTLHHVTPNGKQTSLSYKGVVTKVEQFGTKTQPIHVLTISKNQDTSITLVMGRHSRYEWYNDENGTFADVRHMQAAR